MGKPEDEEQIAAMLAAAREGAAEIEIALAKLAVGKLDADTQKMLYPTVTQMMQQIAVMIRVNPADTELSHEIARTMYLKGIRHSIKEISSHLAKHLKFTRSTISLAKLAKGVH
jgi:hypothetical protein